MMQKQNLNTKKITEFTSEDTIYIRDNKNERKPLYLSKFIAYDKSKGLVEGEIINKDADHERDETIGRRLKARLSDCALYGNATNKPNHAYYRWFDRSGYAMHPLEEHKVNENGVHVEKHPSYGLIGFSRRSGGAGSLFGSSIQSQQTIALRISKAEHKRDISNDWYHSRGEIIEVEMSQIQFAELITSFNMGDGVPCTIRHVNMESYPDPPFLSKTDLFHAEFSNQMHNYAVDMEKVIEQATDILTNKNNIGKGDREVILKGIESLMQHVKSNIPFVAKQFTESMEKTVIEAKGEIEAFVENKIRNAGLEKLGFNKEDHTPQIDYKQ